MAAGYSHPLGPISDSHPPGAAVSFHHAVRLTWMELGLDMVVEPSFDSSDRIVLPEGDEDNPHTRPWRLESHPFMLNVSLVFNPFVFYLGDWMMAGGIRLGAGWLVTRQ